MFKKYESYERKGIRNKEDNNKKNKDLARFVFIKLSFIKVRNYLKYTFNFSDISFLFLNFYKKLWIDDK